LLLRLSRINEGLWFICETHIQSLYD
jgi:hypothetical protein